MSSNRYIIGGVIGSVVILAIGLGIGIGIGVSVDSSSNNAEVREEVGGISEKLHTQINAENIRDNLR